MKASCFEWQKEDLCDKCSAMQLQTAREASFELQGVDLADEELIGYISESCTMSKALEEYEGVPMTARAQHVPFLHPLWIQAHTFSLA